MHKSTLNAITRNRKGFAYDARQSDFSLWSKSRDVLNVGEIGTVTTGFTAPDGLLTAAKYAESGTVPQMVLSNLFGTYLNYEQLNTFRDNWLYTFSVKLKAVEVSVFYLDFGNDLTGAFFDTNNGNCLTDGGNRASCKMVQIDDGWWLCEVTKSLTNATQYTSICSDIVSGGIYSKFKIGTVGNGFLMADMQLRIGR
jgi:hypothetical protein